MSVKAAGLIISLVLIASQAGCSNKISSNTPAAATILSSTGANGTVSNNTPAVDDVPNPSTSSASTVSATAPVTDTRPTILIGLDGGFDPLTMTVAAGTTINFENDDCCNPHAVNSNYPFTQNMDPGLTGSVTFSKPGKYTIWIDNNLSVVGTVTVTS